jgi:hypothetical protein
MMLPATYQVLGLGALGLRDQRPVDTRCFVNSHATLFKNISQLYGFYGVLKCLMMFHGSRLYRYSMLWYVIVCYSML